MKKPAKREVEWELAEGFKDSWKEYLELYPEIKPAMTEFDRCKRANPSKRLPAKMRDHKLDGPLSGFMDCHLANDVILIYKHRPKGVVRLYRVCQHADLKGPKARALAKLLR